MIAVITEGRFILLLFQEWTPHRKKLSFGLLFSRTEKSHVGISQAVGCLNHPSDKILSLLMSCEAERGRI